MNKELFLSLPKLIINIPLALIEIRKKKKNREKRIIKLAWMEDEKYYDTVALLFSISSK